MPSITAQDLDYLDYLNGENNEDRNEDACHHGVPWTVDCDECEDEMGEDELYGY
mgnify:CR=1 FL=1